MAAQFDATQFGEWEFQQRLLMEKNWQKEAKVLLEKANLRLQIAKNMIRKINDSKALSEIDRLEKGSHYHLIEFNAMKRNYQGMSREIAEQNLAAVRKSYETIKLAVKKIINEAGLRAMIVGLDAKMAKLEQQVQVATNIVDAMRDMRNPDIENLVRGVELTLEWIIDKKEELRDSSTRALQLQAAFSGGTVDAETAMAQIKTMLRAIQKQISSNHNSLIPGLILIKEEAVERTVQRRARLEAQWREEAEAILQDANNLLISAERSVRRDSESLTEINRIYNQTDYHRLKSRVKEVNYKAIREEDFDEFFADLKRLQQNIKSAAASIVEAARRKGVPILDETPSVSQVQISTDSDNGESLHFAFGRTLQTATQKPALASATSAFSRLS